MKGTLRGLNLLSELELTQNVKGNDIARIEIISAAISALTTQLLSPHLRGTEHVTGCLAAAAGSLRSQRFLLLQCQPIGISSCIG